MASAAGAQTRGQARRQDSSGDNDFSYATNDQYGIAVFSYVRPQHLNAEVLYDEDLANDDHIAVLQAQVARLQTGQRDQRLAIEGAFLQDFYVDSD